MAKKIAIIGTNGVPSKYGGFETLVEYLVEYLSERYEITVYCSLTKEESKKSNYKGAKLEYIDYSANGMQSIVFDIISIYKTYKQYDKVLILGSSGCIILPLFYKFKDRFIFNFGGLDWQRSKWNFLTRKFLKLSESLGIKYSKYIISDNKGIQEYIENEYKKDSYLITYGGDQVNKIEIKNSDFDKYPFLKNEYVFTVARIQPDNNIEMLLDAFDMESKRPFIFVGNWNKSEYGLKTKKKYISSPNIVLLDAIYDQNELNLLRSNCKVYVHGHSAGGTNPALVEAMNLGLPIIAFNSIFNKYTTNFEADYFSDSQELKEKLNVIANEKLGKVGGKMLQIAKHNYTWEKIANEYAVVFDL